MFAPHFAQVGFGVGVGFGFGLGFANRSWLRAVLAHRLRSLLALLRRKPKTTGFKAVDASAMAWHRNEHHREQTTFFMKPLGCDEGTGQTFMLVRYRAGEINPAHVHPVGHGMYVLEGELATHRGTFGSGHFVWFPAHEAMWHGAGPTRDVVALFAAGSGLDTRYLPQAAAR